MAMDQAILDEVTEKVAGGLRLLGHFKDEARSQVRSVLESAFDGLDVVTNERMQVVEALLAGTREQIKEMEARIATLEARLKKKS